MTIILPKITFLNGPRESGKSTIATAIAERDDMCARVSMAEPIRQALLATIYPDELFGAGVGFDLRQSAVKAKTLPVGSDALVGRPTNRDWMVAFSETFMKPLLGKDVFGQLALRNILSLEQLYDRFIFDDSRFADECHPIINHFGAANCLIIYIEGRGPGWESEPSGSRIEISGVRSVTLDNSDNIASTLEHLQLPQSEDSQL